MTSCLESILDKSAEDGKTKEIPSEVLGRGKTVMGCNVKKCSPRDKTDVED